MLKTCAKCGEAKPLTEFNKDSNKRDGLQTWCKECKKIANAKYYAANPENRRKSSAKWYAENQVDILPALKGEVSRSRI